MTNDKESLITTVETAANPISIELEQKQDNDVVNKKPSVKRPKMVNQQARDSQNMNVREYISCL